MKLTNRHIYTTHAQTLICDELGTPEVLKMSAFIVIFLAAN